MDFETIKAHFNVKNGIKESCMAICPCHADKKASLSLKYDMAGRKTLIYCHAGCDVKDILIRVGLEMKDLFDEEKVREKKEDKIEAVYKYMDLDGHLLFEKVRFKPKAFTQRRYVDGATVWGLGGGTYYETYPESCEYSMKERNNVRVREFPEIKPILYNLPGLIKAVNAKETIFIVEGEKDADNLIRHNLTATTNFNGASKSVDKQKWRKEYNEYLKGADVVLLPDNDNPGKCHMMNIARELNGIVKSIRMVELPVPQKEDVSYYLEEGHTIDDLLNLVKNTIHGGRLIDSENLSLISYNFSDLGNAERLIAIFGSDIRYSFPREKFFIWSGRYWQEDTTGVIYQLAKKTLRRLLAEGEGLDENVDEQAGETKKKVISFAIRSENDGKIRAMVNQARNQPEITLSESNMNLFLLNVANGTLDLKTGKMREHRKRDYITRMIDIEYDQNAECPNWIKFLDKIFMGDSEMMDFVQRSVGYSLTGSEEEQCFYLLYGNGANGKTTFLNTLKLIMGDYADALKASSLMARLYDDGARGDIAKLVGKRFVVSSELNEGQYFDESLIKCFTGGDSIPVRFMYERDFALEPEFKIWMGTNEKPKIRGCDIGIWRRVRIIPFLYTFTGEERDKNFMDKYLIPELPGILNWAVEGCRKWRQEGIKVPQKAMAAMEEYRDEMDIVQHFLDEGCVMGDMYTIKVGDLYQRFCNWCLKSGDRPVSNIKFGKKLKEKGFVQYKTNGWPHWKGIGALSFK